MRAPLSQEAPPKLSLSMLHDLAMGMLEDRRLERAIFSMYVFAALAAFYLVVSLLDVGPDPVKTDMVVMSAIMLPLSLVMLRVFRREQARRKTLAQDNPNP